MLKTNPTAPRINGRIESIKTALNPAQATKKIVNPIKHAAIPSPPPRCASDVAREEVDWLMGGQYSGISDFGLGCRIP
jgi:hypothetical protein